MTKYSKAPWQAFIKNNSYSIHAEDHIVVQCNRDPVVTDECWEMHKQNAKLIAAAPELLNACKKALEFIQNGVEFGYIRLPDEGSTDSALLVKPMLEKIIMKAGEV